MTRSEMKLSLAQIGEKIKEGFSAGKSDEDIAKSVGLPVNDAAAIRKVLGLKRAWRINVFETAKTLGFDDYHEQYKIAFRIPHDIENKLNLKKNHKYKFFAVAEEPDKIQLEIEEVD